MFSFLTVSFLQTDKVRIFIFAMSLPRFKFKYGVITHIIQWRELKSNRRRRDEAAILKRERVNESLDQRIPELHNVFLFKATFLKLISNLILIIIILGLLQMTASWYLIVLFVCIIYSILNSFHLQCTSLPNQNWLHQ